MSTQYTNWQEKGNCPPWKLEHYDWSGEYFPVSHPVRAVVKEREMIDLDTGEVIARLSPGYKFFWAHNHPHVCKADWDGETYPDGWD